MLAQLSLLLLPVAATVGWITAKRDKPSPRRSEKMSLLRLRSDYFKGLNYLINEQPDRAVDVFIKLLEVDSDTVETHLALGNLFRRRGEVDRAIRIHQNLIARPQLDKSYRIQALSALGQDYLFAGVLDRAERLFLEVVKMGEETVMSLRFLLRIYEQEKDWSKAIDTAKKLQTYITEPLHVVIAQYHCELAQQLKESGYIDAARQNLKKALLTDPCCARANLLLGKFSEEAGEYKAAIQYYKQVKDQDIELITEIVEPLSLCYQRLGQERALIQFLEHCNAEKPRVAIILKLAEHKQQNESEQAAVAFLIDSLQHQPSLRGLHYLMGIYAQNLQGGEKQRMDIFRQSIAMLLSGRPQYQCSQCGFSDKTIFLLCRSCHSWSTAKFVPNIEGN